MTINLSSDLINQSDEVTLQGSKQFIIKGEDHAYRIMIAVPDQEPPANGFPVVYLLDGNATFLTVTETMRLQSIPSEKTVAIPALIVGIGYPANQLFTSERFYDYTIGEVEPSVSAYFGDQNHIKQGGADAFLSFIENKLKPVIETNYAIDQDRQTIIGHSLGGLFVLHALFTRPELFQTYIVGSPSIYWNKTILTEEEETFTSLLEKKDFELEILIAVGELEDTHKSSIRMIDNAQELSERLDQKKGLSVNFKEFDNENHISVLPRLINEGLKLALKPKK